jgi:hypothetical protein
MSSPAPARLKSTSADMPTYLDANLHPDKYASGASADSSGCKTVSEKR